MRTYYHRDPRLMTSSPSPVIETAKPLPPITPSSTVQFNDELVPLEAPVLYSSQDTRLVDKKNMTQDSTPTTVQATANIHLPPNAFNPPSPPLHSKFDDIMKFFLERLSLNERTQRDLLNETSQLQHQLADSQRQQDGLLREGVYSKQFVFDNFESCKLAIKNIHDILHATVTQVNMQKDAMLQLFESQRQQCQLEHSRMIKEMMDKIDMTSKQDRVLMAQHLDNVRIQVKDTLDQFYLDMESKLKQHQSNLVSTQQQVSTHDTLLHEIQSLMTRIEMKFTGSFQHSDSNLKRVSQVLHEYTTQTKREEESARERLKMDFYHNLEASLAKLHQEATDKADILRLKYEEIKKMVDEEQSKLNALEKTSLVHLEQRLSSVIDKERQNEMDIVQVSMAIGKLKESLDINRFENHSWRERVRQEVVVMQEEMKKQGQFLKDQLMTEIRKMSRPMIVM